jgi:hypothetical protein
MSNVKRRAGFEQVCVWPGTIVLDDDVREFEAFMLDQFATRIQFLETIVTGPDLENGVPVDNTGGREDVFFAVHNADVMRFAVPRLKVGIRWIEDVIDNGGLPLYPARVAEYRLW